MKKNYLLLSFIVSLTTIGNAQIYVNIDANEGTNSGTSWTNAYTDLQDTIDVATAQNWLALQYIASAVILTRIKQRKTN